MLQLSIVPPCRSNSLFSVVWSIRGFGPRAGNVILLRRVASNFAPTAMIVNSGSTNGLLGRPGGGKFSLLAARTDIATPMGRDHLKARPRTFAGAA